jgi:hypothetical protein
MDRAAAAWAEGSSDMADRVGGVFRSDTLLVLLHTTRTARVNMAAELDGRVRRMMCCKYSWMREEESVSCVALQQLSV